MARTRPCRGDYSLGERIATPPGASRASGGLQFGDDVIANDVKVAASVATEGDRSASDAIAFEAEKSSDVVASGDGSSGSKFGRIKGGRAPACGFPLWETLAPAKTAK